MHPQPAHRDDAIQEFFRSVNDCIRELQRTWLVDDYDVMCECRDPSCMAIMRLNLAEYEAVLTTPGRFVVVPGHERLAEEQVVARTDRYVVVASHDPAAWRLAA